jgi:hypothetical protein
MPQRSAAASERLLQVVPDPPTQIFPAIPEEPQHFTGDLAPAEEQTPLTPAVRRMGSAVTRLAQVRSAVDARRALDFSHIEPVATPDLAAGRMTGDLFNGLDATRVMLPSVLRRQRRADRVEGQFRHDLAAHEQQLRFDQLMSDTPTEIFALPDNARIVSPDGHIAAGYLANKGVIEF